MDIVISALGRDEVGDASRLLARAFAEDPIITHYLHDPVRRTVALPAFFAAVLEEMLPSAQVFSARGDGDLAGIAAWLPPEPIDADEAARARADRWRRIVETMFPLTAQALYDGFAALERLHPAGPHWYLAFVGIEPVLQGRGIGGALLAPVLHVAEELGVACYLETPFPRTHAFYERLGFRRQADHRCFAGAPSGVAAFLRPAGR